MDSRELDTILHQAIVSLPEKLKTPFILRFLDNLPSQEIARRMGLTVSNVYKRIQQARSLLRKVIQPYLKGTDIINFSHFQTILSCDQLPMTDRICEDSTISLPCPLETINNGWVDLCLEPLPPVWYGLLPPLRWQ